MTVDVAAIIQAAIAIAQDVLPRLEKLARAIFGG